MIDLNPAGLFFPGGPGTDTEFATQFSNSALCATDGALPILLASFPREAKLPQ